MKYGTQLKEIAKRFGQVDLPYVQSFGQARGYSIDIGTATYATAFRMMIPGKRGVSYEFTRGNIVGLNNNNYSLKRQSKQRSVIVFDSFNDTLDVDSTGLTQNEIYFLDKLSQQIVQSINGVAA